MERVILRHLKGSRASQLEEFPLQQFAELVFGRDPNSSVRFDPEKDDLVGRQHARISRDAADPYRFKLADLNSRNGTFLNKLRVVGEMPIQPGDVIQLGAGGPEIQFDLDPLPAQYVKATRLGVAGPMGATANVHETRVGATPASAPVAPSPMAAAPGGVGKATVERMIGETKKQSNRTLTMGLAAAAVMVVAVAAWAWQGNQSTRDEAAQREKQMQDSLSGLARRNAAFADSLKGATDRAVDLSKKVLPAEVMARYAASVVQVDTGL